MTTPRERNRKGKAAEHYVATKLLQNDMVPYFPTVDDAGVDLVVETSTGNFARVQVKSRGFALPQEGSYGEQIKDLWWGDGKLAFGYLVIVLPKADSRDFESWVVPAAVVKGRLSKGGDLTLSVKLLRHDWQEYREVWELVGGDSTQA